MEMHATCSKGGASTRVFDRGRPRRRKTVRGAFKGRDESKGEGPKVSKVLKKTDGRWSGPFSVGRRRRLPLHGRTQHRMAHRTMFTRDRGSAPVFWQPCDALYRNVIAGGDWWVSDWPRPVGLFGCGGAAVCDPSIMSCERRDAAIGRFRLLNVRPIFSYLSHSFIHLAESGCRRLLLLEF
jgi:hypothetical protein